MPFVLVLTNQYTPSMKLKTVAILAALVGGCAARMGERHIGDYGEGVRSFTNPYLKQAASAFGDEGPSIKRTIASAHTSSRGGATRDEVMFAMLKGESDESERRLLSRRGSGGSGRRLKKKKKRTKCHTKNSSHCDNGKCRHTARTTCSGVLCEQHTNLNCKDSGHCHHVAHQECGPHRCLNLHTITCYTNHCSTSSKQTNCN